jgi:acyl-CoA-binding protein
VPIVDLDPPDILSSWDQPKPVVARDVITTPGKAAVDLGSDMPVETIEGYPVSPPDLLSAAFRQGNVVGSAMSQVPGQFNETEEPGFRAWDGIKGTKYEAQFKRFYDIENQGALDARKKQIDQEERDRHVIENAPWYKAVPAQIAAGLFDLPTLIPGGAFARAAGGGYAAGRTTLNLAVGGAVGAGVQEAGLHATQQTRPLSESAVNVGASVVLSGLLGYGGAKLLSKAEWDQSVRHIEAFQAVERGMAGEAQTGGVAGEAGAAAAPRGTLDDMSIAGKAAGGLADTTSRLNPLLDTATSPSLATREVGSELMENPLYLKMNDEGVRSPEAVVTLLKEWNSGLAAAASGSSLALPAVLA